MIVGGPGRTRRGSFMDSWRNKQNKEIAAKGTKVLVLKAGRYNGPGHKTVGYCEVGDLICVAPGAYAESLISHGFVSLYDEALEDSVDVDVAAQTVTVPDPVVETPADEPSPAIVATVQAPVAEDPTPDSDGWKIFLDAGVSEAIAQKLYGAGLTSQQAYLDLLNDDGADALLSMPGIGRETVRKLTQWATTNGE